MIFFGSHGLLFHEFWGFCIEWARRGFQICDCKIFPNSFLLSWRKSCVVISKSYWQGTLVSTAWLSSPLKENFSPDGSILVIWIFWAPFEILRHLICKRRDAQLACIQWLTLETLIFGCLPPLCLTRLPLDMTGGYCYLNRVIKLFLAGLCIKNISMDFLIIVTV